MRIFRKWRNYRQKPPFGTEIDWSDPITQGLVGCWLFNEQIGKLVQDLAGFGHNGRLSNGEVYWDSYGVKFISSANIGYVDFGGNDFFHLSKFTTFIITTPLLNDLSGSSNGIFVKGGTATSGSFGLCEYGGSAKFFAHLESGATAYNIFSTTLFTVGKEYSLAQRYGSGKQLLFVNGVEEASVSCGPPDYTNTPLMLGSWNLETGRQYEGIIAIALIWNRALSDDEILRLHEEPYSFFLAPAPWFMIDLGAVTTGYDRLHQDRRAYRGFMRGVL